MEFGDGQINAITNKSIEIVTDLDREIFIIIFSTLLIVGVLLNLGVIWTSKKNCRFSQKSWVIALAISDLITVISFSTNNIETLSHPYINWTLGSFMCHFIPMCQSFGVISSSMTLVGIAMDRYWCIVKTSSNWNLKKIHCIVGVLACWILSGGMSLPMFLFYTNEEVLVIFLDDNGTLPENYTIESMHMCVAVEKEPLQCSYVFLILFVFTPLILVFFWFYSNIAMVVWHQKKRMAPTETKKQNTAPEISFTESSKVAGIPITVSRRLGKPTAVKITKSQKVKKKIRTFRVIIVLILTFIVCRMPFWLFTLIKLSVAIEGVTIWRVNFAITALNILNTILNPLLYTFLKSTLKVCCTIQKGLHYTFCCFFTDDEFVEFEKGNYKFLGGFNDTKCTSNSNSTSTSNNLKY